LLSKLLEERGIPQELSYQLSDAVANLLGTTEKEKTKTILFFSDQELIAMADKIASSYEKKNLESLFKISVKKNDKKKDNKKKNDKKKSEKSEKKENEKEVITYDCKKGELLKGASPVDVADIELFGRMIASDHSLFVEGASSFAHPFSVHACENDADFFSSVDEISESNDQGAGHLGDLEFNSACYYECINLNLDLINSGRLSVLPLEIRRDIIRSMIDACIIAVPTARHNSMLSATKPSSVLGLFRENTFPLSLANAFEVPIRAKGNGYTVPARKRLEEELESMKKAYGSRLGIKTEIWFPDVSLDDFREGLTQHV